MATINVLDFPEITTALDDDIFYTIQGVGAARDKQIKIQNIRTYMQTFDSGLVVGSGTLEVSTGALGIGVSSPSAQLQVHELTAALSQARFTNLTTGATASDGLQIGIDGSSLAIINNRENNDITFYTNNSPWMTLKNNGWLGLGVTDPNTFVEIYRAGAANSIAQFTNGTTGRGASSGFLIGADDSGNACLNQQENLPMIFTVDSVETLRLAGNNKLSTGGETAPDCSAGGITFKTFAGGTICTYKTDGTGHGFTSLAEADTRLQIIPNTTGVDEFSYTIGSNSKDNRSFVTSPNSTTGTGSTAGFSFQGSKLSGSNSTDLTGTENILVIRSGSAVTRFIFKADGTGYADNSWTTFSDRRIKGEFESLEYGLKEINLLEPFRYNRYESNLKAKKESPLRSEIGLIAQDVFKLIPEACIKPDDDSSVWGLTYERLLPVIIKAIQELDKKLESLKEK